MWVRGGGGVTAAQDEQYREWGWQIFNAFEKYTRIETGGYSSLHSVKTIPPNYRCRRRCAWRAR